MPIPSETDRSDLIRAFLLESVAAHPRDLVSTAVSHFGITRQAIHKHLKNLIAQGMMEAEGQTRQRQFRLVDSQQSWTYNIAGGLEEDRAWRLELLPLLKHLPKNALDIWEFCFTEIFNNAIDHSEGRTIRVLLKQNAVAASVEIVDDGIGIFEKLRAAVGLSDERHVALELSKGKLTTDPAKHTGQGIFFTSRLMDTFGIWSGSVLLRHDFGREDDWVITSNVIVSGTKVGMKLRHGIERTCKSIFDQYSSGDDYGFTKTVVPVDLARYGGEQLISRSQAKRLMARVDQFKTVVLDFHGIDRVGQAFADEIFRVYSRSHPDIEIIPKNATPEVQQMIQRARTQWASELPGSI